MATSMVLLTDSDSDWRSDEEEELLRWQAPPTRSIRGHKGSTNNNTRDPGSKKSVRLDLSNQGRVTNTKSIPLTPPPVPERGAESHGGGRGDRQTPPPRTPPPREPDSMYLHGTLAADLKDEQAMKKQRTGALYVVLALSTVAALLCLALPAYIPYLLLIHVDSAEGQTTVYACLLAGMTLGGVLTAFSLKALGSRWVLVAAACGSSLFIIARFFTSVPLVAITAFLGGATFTPGLAALHIRIACVAADFVQNGGGTYSNALHTFHGLVIGWYQSAPLLAAVLCLTLLPGVSKSQTFSTLPGDVEPPPPEENITNTFQVQTQACSQHYTWSRDSHVQDLTSGLPVQEAMGVKYRVQATLGCFLVCSLGALLLAAVGLREPTLNREGEGETLRQRVKFVHVWRVVRLLGEPRLLLLIPVLVYSGMEQMIAYSVFLRVSMLTVPVIMI